MAVVEGVEVLWVVSLFHQRGDVAPPPVVLGIDVVDGLVLDGGCAVTGDVIEMDPRLGVLVDEDAIAAVVEDGVVGEIEVPVAVDVGVFDLDAVCVVFDPVLGDDGYDLAIGSNADVVVAGNRVVTDRRLDVGAFVLDIDSVVAAISDRVAGPSDGSVR